MNSDASALDVGTVNLVLREGPRWPSGDIIAVTAERIGIEYGLSGRSHRLHLEAAAKAPSTLVAKFEHADEITREVNFRVANEAWLAGRIPAWYGARTDREADQGMILMETSRPPSRVTISGGVHRVKP